MPQMGCKSHDSSKPQGLHYMLERGGEECYTKSQSAKKKWHESKKHKESKERREDEEKELREKDKQKERTKEERTMWYYNNSRW